MSGCSYLARRLRSHCVGEATGPGKRTPVDARIRRKFPAARGHHSSCNVPPSGLFGRYLIPEPGAIRSPRGWMRGLFRVDASRILYKVAGSLWPWLGVDYLTWP
jgi:hypothetical protein